MNDFLKNVRMREFEFHEWLDHKLKQVRLEEREACAKVCEELSNPLGNASLMAEHCAAAIRGRGMDLLTQHSQNIGEYDER